MKFEQHLFISYAHLDNAPVPPERDGWISRFHRSLEAVLSMRLGRRAAIWRDAKLAGNDVFADEITAQFPSTAVLLAVLSPRYTESDWCTREVREFCALAEADRSLVVANKARVFKVIKTPVDHQDTLPPVVRETLGFAFYVTDEHGVPLELDPAYGPEMLPRYNVKVASLAHELAQYIKLLEAGTEGPAAAATDAAVAALPAVYLAETSYDLREAREALRSELRLRGHRVLPERELPRDEADCAAAVRAALSACALAVHLVGARYGAVPDGPSGRSVVELQNDWGAQACADGPLERLIWVAGDAATDDVLQQRFRRRLERDAALQRGADLVATDLERFKGTLLASIAALAERQRTAAAAAASAARAAAAAKAQAASAPSPDRSLGTASQPVAAPIPLVYLICDERDRSATIPLRRALRHRGIDVAIPVFEGDAATLRRAHEAQLIRCDGVLVWYGAGDAAWQRTVEHDLRKARGLRDASPLPRAWVVVAPPATADKHDLTALLDDGLIDASNGFDDAAIAPFVATLRP